ncbi:hypothetical protein ACWDBC_29510, partial [Streptomyces parvus]
MEHVPPPAEELARLDRELAELDARRAQLLTRRAWLLAALRPPAPTAAPGWNPSGCAGAPGRRGFFRCVARALPVRGGVPG